MARTSNKLPKITASDPETIKKALPPAGADIIAHFIIPITPRTKKNSQKIIVFGNRRKIVPSDAYTQYERDCAYFLKALGINYPINLRAHFYMDTKRRVDLVNLEEALCDVLVAHGVIQDDNNRIIAAKDGSRVFYDKGNGRTELWIERMEDVQKYWAD